MNTNETIAPTSDAAASPMNAARRLTRCSRSGSATAPIAPPRGTAIWRIPSASPRSSRLNQAITARPVAEFTPAATPPATESARTSTPYDGADPAQTNAADAHVSPMLMTRRSPIRSAIKPQARSVGTEPRKLAARTTPVCVSVKPKSRRIAGAIAGKPSPVIAYDACATTPAPSTVQRYLGRAGVDVTQLLDLVGVRPVAVGAGNFEDDGQLLHCGVREEHADPFAHHAVPDVVVAVAVRAERRLRVVRMEHAQPIEADPRVDVAQKRVVRVGVGDVHTGHVEVTGVETDPEALVPAERVEQHSELVDRSSDRAAGSGRVLHQQPRALAAALEHLLHRGHGSLEARLEPGAQVGADVEHDRVGMDGARRVDGRPHRLDALAVDLLVGRGEIHEVEAVHERGDAELRAPLAEALEVLLVVLRKAPRARALHEQLHRVRVHPCRVVQSFLDPPGTVSAE